ncbi:MAG: hypothetical protein ACREFP_02340 [Acetobacteraceae bacterium]
MAAVLIATTRQDELEPLGTGGHRAISVAPTLRATLLRSLSAEHAALLAEPYPNPGRGEIDWYAESAGEAVPLPVLPPAARAEAEAKLARLGDDIRGLADRLASSRSDADRFLGEMLRLAIVVPDQSYVRLAAGRPVLVGWGHRGADPRYPNPLIIGTHALGESRMPILPPPSAILGEAVGRPSAWLWWAAFAIAVLLWLLPVWMLRRAMAAPVPCVVAPTEVALFNHLDAARTATAALSARLAVLRSEAATPCLPGEGLGTPPPPAAGGAPQ